MVVRSKDLPPTSVQLAARRRHEAVKHAGELRAPFANKRWAELTPPEKEQLLRALAVHFGFIAPG